MITAIIHNLAWDNLVFSIEVTRHKTEYCIRKDGIVWFIFIFIHLFFEGWNDCLYSQKKQSNTDTTCYKTLNYIVFLSFSQPRPVLDAAYKNPCFHKGSTLYCMPYYMLIGLAKCGTTELMCKISQHPDVHIIKPKEPFWFTRGRLTGISFLQYLKTFSLKEKLPKQRSKSVIMGDGSSNTFVDNIYWMDTPENANFTQPEILIPHLVHHLNPQTKLVLILRDPVERLYSAYKFFASKALYPNTAYTPMPEDFHERAKYSTRWLTQCFCTLPRRHCLYNFPYRDRNGLPKFYQRGHYGHSVHQTRMGLYSEYLEDWYSVFPAGQILVVTLEQFSANQTYVLNKIYRHLELKPLADSLRHIQDAPRNANKHGFLPMLTETRELLREFYRPFNKKLAQMLGQDMFLWGY